MVVQLISRRSQPRKTCLRVIDSIIFLLLASGDISVSTFVMPFIAPTDGVFYCMYCINVRKHLFTRHFTVMFAGRELAMTADSNTFDNVVGY